MRLSRLLTVIVLVALLAFGSLTAWSQQSESDTGRSQGPSPGRYQGPLPGRSQDQQGQSMGPPPAVMVTDGHNLYVLQGPWIYQFSASDLSLKKKVQLPRPEPPEGQRPSEGQRPYGGQRP
jgi:hypothetical protein